MPKTAASTARTLFRGWLATAVASLAFVAFSGEALAERFAEPGGDGPADTCPSSDPCDIEVAVEDASVVDGDVITVLPGTYDLDLGQIMNADQITIRGAPGMARPLITSHGGPITVYLTVDGAGPSILRRVEVVRTSTFPGAAVSVDGGVIEQVIARAPDTACTFGFASIIRDSVCVVTGASATAAVSAIAGGGGSTSNTLRNVTAVAAGTSGYGLYLHSEGAFDATLDATNVIAVGAPGFDDVRAETANPIGPPDPDPGAAIVLNNSAYDTASTNGGVNAFVNTPGSGGGVTAPPVFANAAGGDYHQGPGSPTVNAGLATATLLGTNDLDGDPRTLGPAPDIGADEAEDDPPETTISGGPRKRTRKRRARFTLVSSEAGSSFQCSLDGKAFAACASHFVTPKLKRRRRHTLRVRAIDGFKNVDPSPAARSWRILRRKRR
jgi:hypothetical protein